MNKGAIILIVAAIVVVILAVAVIKCYNQITTLRNRVDNQSSQIDVQLKRRADLIPNLVEVTKGYAGYEQETLEAVTRSRSMLLNAQNTEQKYKAGEELVRAARQIFAIGENYPELKANTNFLQLQSELSDTEDKVSAARQFYNDTVTKYNTYIMLFPKSIVAKLFGFAKLALLEATEDEKKAVKIESGTFKTH